MKKFADVTDLIADSLQRSQAMMSQTAGHPAGGMASTIKSMLGGKETSLEQGYGKARGAVEAVHDVGGLKWNTALEHLPTLAGVMGGGWLVKSLYDNWKNKQVGEQMMDDPAFANIDKNKVREAIGEMHNYAPSILRNPNSARGLIKQMVQYDGMTPKDIEGLLKLETMNREAHGVGSYLGPLGDVLSTVI
jgi:hypothetical protein